MVKPLITFENYSFRYDSQAEPTLKNINLDIWPNQKVLILGPSGSGKSTFGKCLNGLIPNAFSGEQTGIAQINGQDLTTQSIGDLSLQVGTVLQDTSAQFVGLTVAEDIAFALENDSIDVKQMHQRVQEWIDRMHLKELAKQSPQDLSGGQKQRVSMGGVLIDQPQILLFDEPLANLDPASGYETIALIDAMQKELQTTVFIIEHRLEEVLSQSVDRILVFNEGEIVFDGLPETLLKSNLLKEVGIRQPLYLSALEYAGMDLATLEAIENLDQVNGPDILQYLQTWNSSHTYQNNPHKEAILLEAQQINFSYPLAEQATLKNLSVKIYQGQMISLVGSNGAGKSTFAKAIAGFVQAQSGDFYWQGQKINDDTIGQRASRIGYVMQDPNQMISQHMIYDEVALGLRLRGYDESSVQERVHQVLKVCGLYPFREWPISALSYGQKKRVTIAAILILEPELLILDEPTAGQDYRHYTEFMRFISDLNDNGMTIMMITHDLQLMLEYTDRTLVIDDGQVIADQMPFEVLTSETLTDAASLRPTSLYYLAKRLNIDDPTAFVQKFISYERQVMMHE